MNVWTEAAAKLLKQHGYPEARYINAKQRDQSSWGTASYAFAVAVGKEIERLAKAEAA